jgi:hypothetical protein
MTGSYQELRAASEAQRRSASSTDSSDHLVPEAQLAPLAAQVYGRRGE